MSLSVALVYLCLTDEVMHLRQNRRRTDHGAHRRQVSFQDRQTAVRRDGVLLASDDIIGLGRCFFQNLRQCLAGYVQALGVDLMLHLLEDGQARRPDNAAYPRYICRWA